MKKHFFRTFVGAIGLMTALTSAAASTDAPVKREMRSTWVATVWQLDWPKSTISRTGDAAQIKRQKDDMTRMLDSLYVNNFNAINFQVRSRCDAMYKSSFEPWSTDLVSERGLDPGWDPLEWVVEECHKRGMECHAWLNPYRFESVTGQWSGLPGDYRKDHPDWVMDVKGASILNPGKEEVIGRICDIIREIVANYDVDGVLFDDYFYLSGTTNDQDGDLYQVYKDAGGTLSQGDWRRDNVNRMVDAVYRTIKETKPWVRFGVSPAGIACTRSDVAAKYGITPCPTGSDWQYNDIYSDPIAWIANQSLDFISPQIYWTIGNGTDYKAAAQWWSDIAAKWDRHFYSSHSISSLTSASKMPGMSGTESDIQTLASGPNSASFAEYADEIRLNRQFNRQDAPGSIFYSAKYLYATAPLFSHYLGQTVFANRALLPVITWQKGENPGMVKNLARSGATLSWEGYDNVRYTVYAFPSSMPIENFDRDARYLADISYTTTYAIPAKYMNGYNFAVCVLDRYGNEYSAASPGVAAKDMDAPVLTVPAVNQSIEAPFYFEWNTVPDATEYVITVARDAELKDIVAIRSTRANSISSLEFPTFDLHATYYWTVAAGALNYNDGVAAVQPFSVITLMLTSPEDGASGVSLTPELVVSVPGRSVTLEVSTDSDFERAASIVYTATGETSFTIPRYTLVGGTTYYARLKYTVDGTDMVSEAISFTTTVVEPVVPEIQFPVHGGDFYNDSHITVKPLDGVRSLRLEVAANDAFASRTSYINSSLSTTTWADNKTGGEIKVLSKNLEDGKTYYAHVRAAYVNEEGASVNTEYCAPIAFTYHNTPAGVDLVGDNGAEFITVNVVDGQAVLSVAPTAQSQAVNIVTMSGINLGTVYSGNGGAHITLDYASGAYILVPTQGSPVKVVIP